MNTGRLIQKKQDACSAARIQNYISAMEPLAYKKIHEHVNKKNTNIINQI